MPDGVIVRNAGSIDRGADRRFLPVGVWRRLQGQLPLLRLLIVLERTIAIASAATAPAAFATIGIALLRLFASFDRPFFLHRILGAIGFGLFDDFRLGFLFGNWRSGLDLRYRLYAAFRIALTDPFDIEIAGLLVFLGIEADGDVVFAFQSCEFAALLVERIDGHVGRDAHH